MIDFFKILFSSDVFMPHGHCYLWRPGVVWLHVASDALITLAYYSIPLTLVHFVRKRKDLEFHWMFVCFAVFIVACGTTHLMEIWNVWHPTYWLAGSIKAITAAASMPTAILLLKLVPQALALPSPTALRNMNHELEKEIAKREQAQAALGGARDDLEVELNERTAELRRMSETLRAEILERMQAEEELRKNREELAHVSRVTTMGEFAASIAHELNQPLGAIVNNSNACLRLINLPGSQEQVRGALSDIVVDANRASTIIAHLRALTRRSVPEKTSVEIKDVVKDVLSLARHSLLERRIAVHIEISQQLPRIAGDRVQLQQVLLNLVSNAIEAMDDVQDDRRKMNICAEPGELESKPAVVIQVQDQGHGFSPEEKGRLFEAFYTTKEHGVGMGLRISRSIIDAHCGRLWATSNPGAGATFSCALPVESNA